MTRTPTTSGALLLSLTDAVRPGAYASGFASLGAPGHQTANHGAPATYINASIRSGMKTHPRLLP